MYGFSEPAWRQRVRLLEDAPRGRHAPAGLFVTPWRLGFSGALVIRERPMIRKLKSGKYRLYSRKVDDKTGRRRNLGTFDSREAAEKHEREVQYFKRH
jgi:hypothetical protein